MRVEHILWSLATTLNHWQGREVIIPRLCNLQGGWNMRKGHFTQSVNLWCLFTQKFIKVVFMTSNESYHTMAKQKQNNIRASAVISVCVTTISTDEVGWRYISHCLSPLASGMTSWNPAVWYLLGCFSFPGMKVENMNASFHSRLSGCFDNCCGEIATFWHDDQREINGKQIFEWQYIFAYIYISTIDQLCHSFCS